jgi:hypothetical protein
MAKQGDTFILANRGIDTHLFVIISDPGLDKGRIVLANFTTWRPDKDQSCVVEAGEHPFVRTRSCIDYRRDRLITLSQYEGFLADGRLISRGPVSQGLLTRILKGAAISPFIPLANRQILVEQGFIDNE